MKEAIVQVWNSWRFQDALVAAILLACFLIGRRLATREYWRMAFRQVFRRRLVRVSSVILCFYLVVALLDSVGYHPVLRDEHGVPRTDPGTGRVVRDPDGLSVLDLVLTPIRTIEEKTYSAPFADRQLMKESLADEPGRTVRDYPPLRHPRRHVLGTNHVGQDVLYVSLKSIRTGMVIGAFTTMLVIPFAILFGVLAGYFGRWVDDVIQYIYTVLASIPPVLLIAAFMVIVGRGLPQLCIILGITSWTGLCRVLRGETFKLRETEYVQAAQAMGVSHSKIMFRHITPNLMHIVLITAVLGFSGRVLVEPVLTYIGIGVGAHTFSWGVMINDALRELARSPVVWWNLLGAFVFMVGLLIPANIFGDALRDALDPRLRTE